MNKGVGYRKLYYKKNGKNVGENGGEQKREKERRKGRKKDPPPPEAMEFEAPNGMGNAILSRDWEEQIHKEH